MPMPRKMVRRTAATHPAPTPQQTPCRLWQGNADASEYGLLPTGRRVTRWVLESTGVDQFGNAWHPALNALHLCDNPPCYRYDHLWLGTLADNNADMVAKGRQNHPPRTHCFAGHELNDETIYIAPDGRRRCRLCRTQAHTRYLQRRRTQRTNERMNTTMNTTTESQAH